MCQPSKPSEADGSEQGHLQPPSPTLCPTPRAQPPAAQPRAHQLLPWQLHTRLWGCSWESLKPEHRGMTVDQLLWHQCISEDYLLFRLFTLNHQEWTRDAPDSCLRDVSCSVSLLWEQKSRTCSRFPERRTRCVPGDIYYCVFTLQGRKPPRLLRI